MAITALWAYDPLKGRALASGLRAPEVLGAPLRKEETLYASAISTGQIFWPGMFVALNSAGAIVPAWHGDPPATTGKSLFGSFGIFEMNPHSAGVWLKSWDTAAPPAEIKPGNWRVDFTDYTEPEPSSYWSVDTFGAEIEDGIGGQIAVGTVSGVPIEKGAFAGDLAGDMAVYLVDAWRLTVSPAEVVNAYEVGRLRQPIRVHAESNLEMWSVKLYSNALDPVPAPLP